MLLVPASQLVFGGCLPVLFVSGFCCLVLAAASLLFFGGCLAVISVSGQFPRFDACSCFVVAFLRFPACLSFLWFGDCICFSGCLSGSAPFL